jgi:hypothetical protein
MLILWNCQFVPKVTAALALPAAIAAALLKNRNHCFL